MSKAVLLAFLIHGADSRQELFELDDPALAALARTRTVALMNEAPRRTLRESARLCEEERFGDQPVGAFCSGVLVEPDLVLTAGHCVPDEETCASTRLAIGWRLDEDGALIEESPRRCVAVEAHDEALDFALLRIDPASDVPPLAISERAFGPLALVGHPAGLPAKIDLDASVVSDGEDTFRLAADAFAGSSGSAIYDADLALAGILIGGRADFRYQLDRACFVSRTAGGSESELALHARSALDRGCGGGSLGALLLPLITTSRRRSRRRRGLCVTGGVGSA